MSRIYNTATRLATGVKLHDMNCGLLQSDTTPRSLQRLTTQQHHRFVRARPPPALQVSPSCPSTTAQGRTDRTHSKFGLYECVNIKLRVWEPSALRNPWWHPYDETLARALKQAAIVLYGRPSIRAAALRDGAAPLLKLGIRLARGAARR